MPRAFRSELPPRLAVPFFEHDHELSQNTGSANTDVTISRNRRRFDPLNTQAKSDRIVIPEDGLWLISGGVELENANQWNLNSRLVVESAGTSPSRGEIAKHGVKSGDANDNVGPRTVVTALEPLYRGDYLYQTVRADLGAPDIKLDGLTAPNGIDQFSPWLRGVWLASHRKIRSIFVYANVNATAANGAETKVDMNVVDHDWGFRQRPDRLKDIVIPEEGIYFALFQVQMDTSGHPQRTRIKKVLHDGTEQILAQARRRVQAAGVNPHEQVCALFHAYPGETISGYVTQDSGSDKTIQGGAAASRSVGLRVVQIVSMKRGFRSISRDGLTVPIFIAYHSADQTRSAGQPIGTQFDTQVINTFEPGRITQYAGSGGAAASRSGRHGILIPRDDVYLMVANFTHSNTGTTEAHEAAWYKNVFGNVNFSNTPDARGTILAKYRSRLNLSANEISFSLPCIAYLRKGEFVAVDTTGGGSLPTWKGASPANMHYQSIGVVGLGAAAMARGNLLL